MLWKAGCLVTVLGFVVTFSSCALFGRAIQTATEVHEVANLSLQPGMETVHPGVVVDSGRGTQLRIDGQVQLLERVVDEATERADIVQLSAPVNYSVFGPNEQRVHRGAGTVSGSVIVPEASSPHRDSFDPEATISHSSETFSVREAIENSNRDVLLTIRVTLPATDDDENPIVSARLSVVERPLDGAGKWTLGGFLSVVFGPVVSGIGLLLFVIGLFTRQKKSTLPPIPGGGRA